MSETKPPMGEPKCTQTAMFFLEAHFSICLRRIISDDVRTFDRYYRSRKKLFLGGFIADLADSGFI